MFKTKEEHNVHLLFWLGGKKKELVEEISPRGMQELLYKIIKYESDHTVKGQYPYHPKQVERMVEFYKPVLERIFEREDPKKVLEHPEWGNLLELAKAWKAYGSLELIRRSIG
ncbi:MAG: hypothetical protein GXN92_01175 [Candidatus Micrarchaeota archaeon]|nr:hypothetical protein [Candidatus Micrarchaeota archaeon]